MKAEDSKNIIPPQLRIQRASREKLLGQKALVIWFTGLSGSGKSTLANLLEIELNKKGVLTYLLDGDVLRGGLNQDLDFSEAARTENLRRTKEVSKLLYDTGSVVICSFISPSLKDRADIKASFPKNDFIEVFVDCPLEICEQRDVKGLYKKARNGEIKDFTGISAPYEKPLTPEIKVETHLNSQEKCLATILEEILPKINE